MWKAIIKLIEKWAYRCDHDWQLVEQRNILDREMYDKGVEINTRTKIMSIYIDVLSVWNQKK